MVLEDDKNYTGLAIAMAVFLLINAVMAYIGVSVKRLISIYTLHG